MPLFFWRICLAVSLLWLAGCQQTTAATPPVVLQDGDILFQSLPHGDLVDAIEGATGSPFSHCGIAHQTDHGWVVIEAIGPVKETKLSVWIGHGRRGRYTVYRLREAYRDCIPAMITAAKKYLGRPYDIHYEMDDKKIYCSELIYKAFKRASGEELGQLVALGKLNWGPHVRVIEAIEHGRVPLERMMITPRSVSEAEQLELVAADAH